MIKRIQSPTPSFFRKLRNAGLALAAVSTAIITAPVSLPAVITTIAGYMALAGAVVGAVSQLTTDDRVKK